MNRILPAAAALWADAERVAEMDALWAGDERTQQLEALAYEMVKGVPHRSILDLACGTARYADAIKGWRTYVGVDSSPHMIKLAAERMERYGRRKVELVLGNVLNHDALRFFDLAVCSHLAQHYERPLDLTKDIIRSAPAKHVFVSFIVHGQPAGTVDFKIGWEGEEDGSNIASRSVAEGDMRRFLAGHEVVALERVPVWWHEDAKHWYALVRRPGGGA